MQSLTQNLFAALDADLLFFAGRAALLIVAFISFAVAFGRWRRTGTREMESLMSQLDESRSETRGIAELTQGLATQLAALQRNLEERAQLAQAAPANGGGIDLAVRLARQGSNIDDIVKTCGVTRNEAQLLARLHVAEVHRQA